MAGSSRAGYLASSPQSHDGDGGVLCRAPLFALPPDRPGPEIVACLFHFLRDTPACPEVIP